MTQLKSGTCRLRWRALNIKEWRAIPNKTREVFAKSKGKKNPPVRGADIPGRYFLDVYENGKRWTKNINLRTTYDRQSNDQTERAAQQVAINYGDIEWRERHHFDPKGKGQIPFVDFFKSQLEGRHWAWQGMYLILLTFPRKDTPLSDIDYDWLSDLKEHLLKSPTRSRRTLSQNSASTYYAKIKASLQIATQRGLIRSNPAQSIKPIAPVPSQRVYLTLDEIQQLANTPCQNAELRRGFLFSCFTGLRLSDVQALTWGEVRNGRLEFRVKKTNRPEWMDLSPSAIKLLGARGKPDEPVFDMPPDGTAWVMLQVWAVQAGLTKHISFHVARHSFGTMMLEHVKDIYLVSKLMGHADVKATQIYAKIVDERKREAMQTLPQIELP